MNRSCVLAAFLLVGALLIAAGCAAPTPTQSPISSPVSAVTLPPDAPGLIQAGCPGWPDGVQLSFAAWTTFTDLGMPGGSERVFVIVTRDRITQIPMIGSPIEARGICWTDNDGGVHESAVADDWRPGGGE